VDAHPQGCERRSRRPECGMAHTKDAHPPKVLTDMVQQIVMESGNPEGFNAEAWLQEWLAAPLPAFGNRRPWDVLQEPEGLAVVRATLLQIQKGSFA
jgi:hypothetical protein